MGGGGGAGLDRHDFRFDPAPQVLDEAAVFAGKFGELCRLDHFRALAVGNARQNVGLVENAACQLANGDAIRPVIEAGDAAGEFVGAVTEEGIGFLNFLLRGGVDEPADQPGCQVRLRHGRQQRLALLLLRKCGRPVSVARLGFDVEANVVDERIGLLEEIGLDPPQFVGIGAHRFAKCKALAGGKVDLVEVFADRFRQRQQIGRIRLCAAFPKQRAQCGQARRVAAADLVVLGTCLSACENRRHRTDVGTRLRQSRGEGELRHLVFRDPRQFTGQTLVGEPADKAGADGEADDRDEGKDQARADAEAPAAHPGSRV